MLTPKRGSRPALDSMSFRREVVSAYPPGWSPEEPPPQNSKKPSKKPSKRRLKWAITIASIVIGVALVGTAATALIPTKNQFAVPKLVVSAAKTLIEKPVELQGQTEGRTNMIVMGMTKDGLRTDSIMLGSYYFTEKKFVTVNIPRDLYVNDGFEYAKMGEVYAYAKARQPKTPTYPDTFLASLVSKEYGIPINYWVKFNMQGEVQLVDALGGVDLTVPDTFTDYEYPTWDYSGYIRPAPHFTAGPQHMDGATALIFSRSRHSLDSSEGTDFARSKRQQIVLQAVMDKVKAMGILGNLGDISKYLNILGQNVETNLNTDEMVAMAKLFKSIDTSQDYVKGNWSTSNGFLCSSTSQVGAYITLYGVPGSCGVAAGTTTSSKYHQMAIYYIQNLLTSAPLTSADFVAASNVLGASTQAPTPSPVSLSPTALSK